MDKDEREGEERKGRHGQETEESGGLAVAKGSTTPFDTSYNHVRCPWEGFWQ